MKTGQVNLISQKINFLVKVFLKLFFKKKSFVSCKIKQILP